MLDALHHRRFRTALLQAIPTGIALGLALSTKLNTALFAGVIPLWAMIALWRTGGTPALIPPSRTIRLKFLAMAALTIAAVSIIVILALNPYLHPAPLRNARVLVAHGQQVYSYDVPEPFRLRNWPDRLHNLVVTSFFETGAFFRYSDAAVWHCDDPPLCLPRAYMWGRPIPENILGQRPWWDLILAAAGLLALLLISARGAREEERYHARLLLAWLLVTAVGVLVLTPFRWERWYLPLEPAWAITSGWGLVWWVRQALGIIRNP
jgi:hypothetical protein